MKPFVILGAGRDAVEIVRRVQQDYPVITVDHDRDAPGHALTGYCCYASCYDADEVLASLSGEPISGVLCGGVDAPHVQAAVSKTYRVVGPSEAAVRSSTNKLDQIRLFKMAGLNVPETCTVWLPSDLRGWADQAVVIKPDDCRGARGVHRFLEEQTSDEVFVDAISLAQGFSRSHIALGQQWIEGEQLSTESIVLNGKVVWTSVAVRNYSRLAETAPYVIEDGSDIPWEPYFNGDTLAPEDKLREALQACVSAMWLKDGTLKGDLVWDGEQIWVIEVAPRLSGGGFCSVLTPAAWGIDFVGWAMYAATGPHGPTWLLKQPKLLEHICQRFEFPLGSKTTMHPERGRWVLGRGKTRREAQASAATALEEGIWHR